MAIELGELVGELKEYAEAVHDAMTFGYSHDDTVGFESRYDLQYLRSLLPADRNEYVERVAYSLHAETIEPQHFWRLSRAVDSLALHVKFLGFNQGQGWSPSDADGIGIIKQLDAIYPAARDFGLTFSVGRAKA